MFFIPLNSIKAGFIGMDNISFTQFSINMFALSHSVEKQYLIVLKIIGIDVYICEYIVDVYIFHIK